MSDPALTRPRVLVAEDNPVSRMILQGQLAAMGFDVDTAENGLEALEASARTRYAAIFLDCQMPEMDGFEAARRIRGREGDGERTPIIAVTATDAEGDFRAAGMDAGISKPVSSDDLGAVLGRYLKGRSAAAEPAAAQGLEGLRRIGERRGSAALVRLARLCLRQIPERLDSLRRAVGESDARRVEEDAHFVKGTARSIGAESFAACLDELERCGRSGDLEEAVRRLAAATEEYERLERDLRALLAEHDGAGDEN